MARKIKTEPITGPDNYTRNATLVRVIDGDTVQMMIDVGFDEYTKKRMRLRVVNTNEMKEPGVGQIWKAWTENWFTQVEGVYVRTYRYQVDRYARYLVEVWGIDKTTKQVRCLIDDLLAAGCPRSKYK